MSTLPFRIPTLVALQALLKPLGYRKSSNLFSLSKSDLVYLVELQGSRHSTAAESIFTVNLGIFAPCLVYADVRDITKPSVSGAHWRERLGILSPEGRDLWWSVSDSVQAAAVAQEVSARVEHYALPIFGSIRSLSELVALWQAGKSPGLTARERDEYLARLAQRFGAA
jgi:Domain of unknown function (DUF4304)